MKKQTTSANQFGLSLFVGRDAQISEVLPKCVKIEPRYKTEKDADGHTVKNADGTPVLAKDDKGNPIVISVSMRMLPKRSEDAPSLQDMNGGLTGQDEMLFVERVESEAAIAMLARMQKAVANGTHTFGGMRMTASGRIVGGLKPKSTQIGAVVATPDEVLVKTLTERGYSVKAPSPLGQTEIALAPAKAKGKKAKGQTALTEASSN